MARRTKEEAQETRQAILDAAVRVFAQQGVANASLTDIAQEAGVTRGAIYWHFANKADLINTLWELGQSFYSPLTLASGRIDRRQGGQGAVVAARLQAGHRRSGLRPRAAAQHGAGAQDAGAGQHTGKITTLHGENLSRSRVGNTAVWGRAPVAKFRCGRATGCNHLSVAPAPAH